MKKFIYKCAIFSFLIIIVDFSFGIICKYLQHNAKGGYTKAQYEAFKKQKADILVLGSSRSICHYVPQILEDSLKMSVYDCGMSANGIIFQYPQLMTILDRHTPKIIIYEILPDCDIYQGDNIKYLGALKRFYGNNQYVHKIYKELAPIESTKLISNLYKYNGEFIHIIRDFFKPSFIADRGFTPKYGQLTYTPIDDEPQDTTLIDNYKKSLLLKMIDICHKKNISLVFSASPHYKTESFVRYNPIIQICKEQKIPFISFYNDPEISDSKKYFVDSKHMNIEGAKLFTLKFVNKLMTIQKMIYPHP